MLSSSGCNAHEKMQGMLAGTNGALSAGIAPYLQSQDNLMLQYTILDSGAGSSAVARTLSQASHMTVMQSLDDAHLIASSLIPLQLD